MPRLRSISLVLAASLAAAACTDATAPSAEMATYDLLFESMASPLENQSQLFLLREGETTPTPVLGGTNWSPDGTQLVFAHTISPALSSLVIVTLATGAQRTLVTGNAHNPAWSPTRDLIAFSARQPIESAELFVIPAVGGTAQRITTNEVPDRYPNWVRRTP